MHGGHCPPWKSASSQPTSHPSSSPNIWPKSPSSARPSPTIATATPTTISVSALIKSIRGSDPDAALYWLARMLEGGEDVRFLARRLVILASEDVGNADPQGLTLAVAAAATPANSSASPNAN